VLFRSPEMLFVTVFSRGRKALKKMYVRNFLGPGGVLLYCGHTLPELRSNTSWRPLRGYESTPLATGISMGTIFANKARLQGLWNSLELERNDFIYFVCLSRQPSPPCMYLYLASPARCTSVPSAKISALPIEPHALVAALCLRLAV
jgi:hypothetical protein